LPWFFNKASASEAQSFAAINWKAATQLPGFINDSGKIAPFIFNGISTIVPTNWGEDGISFQIKPVLLDHIPANFSIGAGEQLAKSAGIPTLEWVSGQFRKTGPYSFKIYLDRSWPNTANYIGVRQLGNDTIRSIFQPAGLTLTKNNAGKQQQILFEKISDLPIGTKKVKPGSTFRFRFAS